MGGEEGSPGSRRLSRDNSRKSIDAVRRSVDHTRRSIERSRRRLLRKGSNSGSAVERGCEESQHDTTSSPLEHTPVPTPTGLQDQACEIRTSYLLISPLLGTVAGLATMSLSTLFQSQPQPKYANTANLVNNPTFVIYGAGDFFTSAKKLKKWCAGLKGQGPVEFRSKEVEGAGHFWRKEGVEDILRESVGGWVEEVVIKSVRDGEGGSI